MSKAKPSPPVVTRLERAAALKTLLTLMISRTRVPSLIPPPSGNLADPTKLACESAASSVSIAHDCAALGTPGANNGQLAASLWTETLAQIGRIQRIHGLPPMPFQGQPPPPGPANDPAGT